MWTFSLADAGVQMLMREKKWSSAIAVLVEIWESKPQSAAETADLLSTCYLRRGTERSDPEDLETARTWSRRRNGPQPTAIYVQPALTPLLAWMGMPAPGTSLT